MSSTHIKQFGKFELITFFFFSGARCDVGRKKNGFSFSKSKTQQRKNVFMYNFYFILKFHKNRTHGDGENLQNSIRAVRNIVRSVSCRTNYTFSPVKPTIGGRFLPYRNRLLRPLRPIFIRDTQDFHWRLKVFVLNPPFSLEIL